MFTRWGKELLQLWSCIKIEPSQLWLLSGWNPRSFNKMWDDISDPPLKPMLGISSKAHRGGDALPRVSDVFSPLVLSSQERADRGEGPPVSGVHPMSSVESVAANASMWRRTISWIGHSDLSAKWYQLSMKNKALTRVDAWKSFKVSVYNRDELRLDESEGLISSIGVSWFEWKVKFG